MEESKNRRVYDREFKKEAVRLVEENGRSISEVSEELGITGGLLHKWKKQLSDDPKSSFPGKGHLKAEEEELRKLRKELADIREERDILKKAVSIFSKTR